MDLEKASPGQFTEKFRASYSGTDDVLRKSTTFFINGATEAGIKISPYIMKHKKPRSGLAKTRVPKSNGASLNQNEASVESKGKKTITGSKAKPTLPQLPPANGKTPYQVLMDDIYDPSAMQSDEEKAVFTLARFLKKKEAGA